jgi:SAM-dependent methyltransferase
MPLRLREHIDGVRKRIAQRAAFADASYDPVDYWGTRAQLPETAAVMWPNVAYNDLVDRHQWRIIEERLPVARDAVLDFGCGTGRLSARLAGRFGSYTGVDLLPMLEVARRENPALAGSYVGAKVTEYDFPKESFDMVVSVSSLCVACTKEVLAEVGRKIVDSIRPGGRLLLVEPFHKNRLVTRGCRMTPREAIDLFERLGMRLASWTGMMFLPARFALAERPLAEFPRITELAYRAGEALLSVRPTLLSDLAVIALDRP